MALLTSDDFPDVAVVEPIETLDRDTPQAIAPAPRGAKNAALNAALNVLLISAWLALATGLIEGLYWFLRQQLDGAMVFMHPGFLWISPLVQLTLVVVPGLGLAAFAWREKSSRVLPSTVILISLVGWLNCLHLAWPGLHFGGWILLASGLAAASGRVFQRYTSLCLLVARRTIAWMLFFIFLAAVAQGISSWRRDSSAVAVLPDAPADAPNVLLIVLDTLRADVLRTDGTSSRIAPNLAEIAERGVVFKEAYTTAPWTLPSQAGMFTGRLPLELSADWLSKLDETYPTLAEELSWHGWSTGGFVGNTRYCSAETGLARGFHRYEAYRLSWADALACTAIGRKFLFSHVPVHLGLYDWPGRKRADEVSDGFLSWLECRGRRPFFAFLNYWDAHDPYFAPPDFRSREAPDVTEKLLLRHWWWMHKEGLSDDYAALIRTAYEDCVRGLDAHLGKLFEQLEDRGELKNTLVIITADHGEHFGEHDLFLHGNSLYEPLLHAPLIVIWPGKVPAGVQVDSPVSLQGLPKTICELLGRETSFPGRSWSHHWNTNSPVPTRPDPVFAEIASQAGCPPCHGRSPIAGGAMRCVRVGMMKYIHNGDGSEELFDLSADRFEERNLAQDPKHAAVLARLRRELNALQPADR